MIKKNYTKFGLTGLASAYHLGKGFPHKRIVLLEAARCGCGASGRNGGILQGFDDTLIMELYQKHGLETVRRYLEIDRQGSLLMHDLHCPLFQTYRAQSVAIRVSFQAVRDQIRA